VVATAAGNNTIPKATIKIGFFVASSLP